MSLIDVFEDSDGIHYTLKYDDERTLQEMLDLNIHLDLSDVLVIFIDIACIL